MKTVITILVTIGILAAIFCLVFPWGKVLVKQTKDDVDQALADQVRDQKLVELAKADLEKQRSYIRDRYAEIIDAKQQLAEQKTVLDSKRKQLAKEESFFQQDTNWLDSHSPSDKLLGQDGKEYDHATVVRDARIRAEKAENLRVSINTLEQSCPILDGKIQGAESNVKDALRAIEVRRGEIVAKEVQLAALRVLERTMIIAQGLSVEGVNFEDRFMREIDKRINKRQAAVMFSEFDTGGRAIIPWEDEGVSSDLDVINVYRNRYLTPAATPASSTQPAPVIPDEALGQ